MKKLNSDKFGFHLLAAIVLTIVLMVLVVLFLRLFTRHGREFEMPSFVGQNAESLTQRGRTEGFVFIVNEHLYEDGKAPGTVLKQDPAAGEKVKLGKRLEALRAQAEEVRVFEEKIHHLADQMIAIDLDDGVKVNYAKFADVLAPIK